MRIHKLPPAACGLLLTLAAPAFAATLTPGTIVVAGSDRVVSIDPRTGNQVLISTDDKSVAAGGLALIAGGELFGGIGLEPGGTLVVQTRRGSYDAPNPNPSRLIRIDPATGAQSLIQGSDDRLTFSQLTLAIGPRGEIYFGEENSNPGNGLFKADPISGAITPVTNATISASAGGEAIDDSPMALWVDTDGTLWLETSYHGLLRVEPASGKMTVFSSDALSAARGGAALYHDPRSLTRAPNGDFFVVEDPQINDSPHYGASDGKLIRIDHVTGAQSLVSSNALSLAAGGKALMHRPYSVAWESDGHLLVTDQSANRIVRIDPATGAQSLVAAVGAIQSPSAMLVVPGLPPPGAATLTVSTQGIAGGYVTTAVAGEINCGHPLQTNINAVAPGTLNVPFSSRVRCAHDYTSGAVVTLIAHADAGGSFAGFSGGGCSGTGPTCDVTLSQAQAVSATFAGRPLTVTTTGPGSGYVTSAIPGLDCGLGLDRATLCTADYANGEDVYLFGNPYPAAGHSFGGFSGCAGTGNSCEFNMTAARTVTATFNGTTPVRHTLTVVTAGSGAGVVSASPTGIDCGRNVGGHTSCTATYGPESYANNARLVLTARALQGNAVTAFTGTGCAGDTCTLAMSQDRAVTATFDLSGPVQRTLTVTTSGAGSGYVDSAPAGIDCGLGGGHDTCSRGYDDQTRVVLAAHAPPGTRFNGFTGGGCTGIAPTCQVLMTQARAVTAKFETAPTVSFSRAARTVNEGANASIYLVLSATSARNITVELALGGSATAGADYVAPPTTVTIRAGSLQHYVSLPITDDTLTEGKESVILRIVSVTNAAALAPAVYTATINASD